MSRLEQQGTVQREQIYVYGTCALCGDSNVLVYDLDSQLVCAHDYRRLVRRVEFKQACDTCGKLGSVRDPLHRRNEYLCMSCHSKNGFIINNSVVKRTVSSMNGGRLPIGIPATCFASGYGTPCDKNIKPRSAWGGKLLCNNHGKGTKS